MYEKAIVTFLDILGFADIIHQSNPQAVKAVLDRLESFTVPDIKEESGCEPEAISFSDSVVRVRRLETEANKTMPFGILFNEILDLVHAQGMLIDSGVLLRGGIAFGDVRISGKQVFGPALASAYELESKYAQYPRIVVSASLFRELKTCPLLVASHHDPDTEISFISDMLTQGDDGMWFIDYGRAIARELDEPEMYPIFLKRHRGVVLRGIRRFRSQNRAVLVKYVWLASYHNKLVQEIDSEWCEQLGVKKHRLLIKSRELPMWKGKDA